MRNLLLPLVASFALAGCVAAPIKPVDLTAETLSPASGKVGVVMTALPKVDTFLPGADCLLCLAAASAANSALDNHAETLSNEDLAGIRNAIADQLTAKGMQVVRIDETIDFQKLPKNRTEGEGLPPRDFTSLQQRFQVDKLLVVQVHSLGFERTYSSYIATGDPKAMVRALGYMVDLKTNTYTWYLPVTVLRAADGTWDEKPSFPGLTNAFYQAIEVAKDSLLEPFKQ